jgi:hypothetical protein
MNLIDSPVRPGIDLERLNALAFDSDFEDGDGHQP